MRFNLKWGGGGRAVPVGTLGGKITIIHRRKSKVASRVVNSHRPIPRRLTSSINWGGNNVANGLIPRRSLQLRGGFDKFGVEKTTTAPFEGKFVIYEFGNAWNPKGPGEATGHHLLPSGTVHAGHVGLLSKIREKLPGTLVRTPARRKLLGKYRPRGRNISRSISSRNTFTWRLLIMFDIDNKYWKCKFW